MAVELESSRVLLRSWQQSDLEPWIALNLDPENLRYFPRIYSAEESHASFLRIRELLNENLFGLWAAQEKSSGSFMGFVGIAHHNIPGIAFMPCHEIGWRLDKKFWGKGYATEAAKVVLEYVVVELDMPEIFSFTAKGNFPSINVMKKIGLQERPELAFEHPRIDDESPLKSHVVYST
jgi:ribosomal-protein-alanine N-acetyltransferase